MTKRSSPKKMERTLPDKLLGSLRLILARKGRSRRQMKGGKIPTTLLINFRSQHSSRITPTPTLLYVGASIKIRLILTEFPNVSDFFLLQEKNLILKDLALCWRHLSYSRSRTLLTRLHIYFVPKLNNSQKEYECFFAV